MATAPSGLSATASTYSTVGLAWTNGATYIHVEIQRKIAGGTYSGIHTVHAGEETYSDTSCSGSVRYYYRVRGFHFDDGYTDWCDEANVWTPPQLPSGFAVAYSGKTATLTWTNNGVAYTTLHPEWKTTAGSTWTAVDSISGTLATTTITVTTEAVNYDFRIRAYYSSSTLYSTYATATSQLSGIMAPTNVFLSCPSTTSVKVDWQDNSAVETGFEVYIGTPTVPPIVGDLETTTAADIETYTITGLSESTEYAVHVRAITATQQSAYPAQQTITTGALPDGDPVIGTVTTVSQTSLTVTWTDTATNADTFHIFRSDDDVAYEEIDDVETGTGTYTDTGLTSYTTYYYKIRAYNEAGWSAFSASANGTTTIDLDAPTNLYAEAVSATQIKITFTNNAGDATYHCVERKVSGGSFSQIGTTTTNSYTDGTPSAGVLYTYRIRAYNSTALEYGDYSSAITKSVAVISGESVRRNETFMGLGNILAVATEDATNTTDCYYTTKPLDFAEQDPEAEDCWKTIHKIVLSFVDIDTTTPVSIKVSTNNGLTWNTVSRNLGIGDGKQKVAEYHFVPITAKQFTVRVQSNDNDTKFTWTGLKIYYERRGQYFEYAPPDNAWDGGEFGTNQVYTIEGGSFTGALDYDYESNGEYGIVQLTYVDGGAF